MPQLPVPPVPTPAPGSPLDLYERLQVTEPGLTDLWVHQGTALRDYHTDNRDRKDVALELPTGAGKTLVGLLIAEWRRLALRHPVAYACVTNQLAEQVAGKAARYGIDVVLLTGSKHGWGAKAATFRGSHAVGITNYHHVFNYWSGVDAAKTLIFDDAHSGEGPVAGPWSISILQEKEPGLFANVLGVVQDALSSSFVEFLEASQGRPTDVHQIELVPPTALTSRAGRLLEVLHASVVDGSHNQFALKAIADGINRCLVYVSPHEILIRPFIPPTRDLSHFADAEQRLYMSATLGAGGELERAFGVDSITRIPADSGQQRSGRRLLLMPGLRIDDAPADALIRDAISATPRTAIITPSDRATNEAADSLLDERVARMGPGELDRFIQTEPAALLLANRYDGIDLPDKQCRLIVLSGAPVHGHLQERFLYRVLGATQVLTERVRTRIIQGAGRATRNRQDFAAVILRGDELLRFIQNPESRAEMRPELQVELELGEWYSREASLELREVLRIFWEHEQEWQPTETYIRDQVAARARQDSPVTTALAASARYEVRASWSYWQGDLRGAVNAASSAIAALTGEPLRAYRALWEYFAASWAALLALEQPKPELTRASSQLRANAETTARMLRWFPRFEEDLAQPAVGPDYDARAERTTVWVRQVNTRRRRFDETIGQMRDNLARREATPFHMGLETLGQVLGFETWRDDHTAACPDAVWRDVDRLWVLFEAKTLQDPGAALPARDVREANSHDNWVEAQLGWAPRPDELITAIVTPRESLGPGADVVADPDATLVHPDVIEDIADRAVLAMSHVRGVADTRSDIELAEEISGQLIARGLDSDSLVTLLTGRRLSPAAAET